MVPSQELKSQFSHGFAILQLKHRKDTKKSEKQADFENFSDKSRDFFPYYQKKTYFCAIKQTENRTASCFAVTQSDIKSLISRPEVLSQQLND